MEQSVLVAFMYTVRHLSDLFAFNSKTLTYSSELSSTCTAACRQWRIRLRACVKTKGGHFEQTYA